MATDDRRAYAVQAEDDNWKVVDPQGGVVMTCRDERSAEHYATLLSRAYSLGYKAGYRAGRES